MQAGPDGGAGTPAARGLLRTYLGIAPGVGKTYAMLRDGRAERRGGVDAVLAFWQRHGREGTAAHSRMLSGSTVADQVLRVAGDLPVQVVNVGRPDNRRR